MPIRLSPNRLATAVALALLLSFAHLPLGAQSLFYNGNLDGVGGVPSYRTNDALGLQMTYDNFVVSGTGWNVTGIFGEWLTNAGWTQAEYEIRSGVVEGAGGVLVFSGTDAAPGWSPTGRTAFGLEEYRIGLSGLSFYLAPETYWLGIALGNKVSAGQTYLATTSGFGGLNAITDGNYFFDAPALGMNFRSDAFYSGQGFDFSYGVEGTVAEEQGVVPEPTTVALLASGLAGLAAASRSRQVAKKARGG